MARPVASPNSGGVGVGAIRRQVRQAGRSRGRRGGVDNELDGRLGRLETTLAEMGEALFVLTDRQQQVLELVRMVVGVVVKEEPPGPPLHVLLAALVRGIEGGTALAAQTLSVVERLAGEVRPVGDVVGSGL